MRCDALGPKNAHQVDRSALDRSRVRSVRTGPDTAQVGSVGSLRSGKMPCVVLKDVVPNFDSYF